MNIWIIFLSPKSYQCRDLCETMFWLFRTEIYRIKRHKYEKKESWKEFRHLKLAKNTFLLIPNQWLSF